MNSVDIHTETFTDATFETKENNKSEDDTISFIKDLDDLEGVEGDEVSLS